MYYLLTTSEVCQLLCTKHNGQIGALPQDAVTLDSRPLSYVHWRQTNTAPTRSISQHACRSMVIRIDHVNWGNLSEWLWVTTLPLRKN